MPPAKKTAKKPSAAKPRPKAAAKPRAKKPAAKRPPSPAFRQKLIATLKRVLPLELTLPGGLVLLKYELTGEPSFSAKGFSAPLRLRHFGQGRTPPIADKPDPDLADEAESKRLEKRLKELEKASTDPGAMIAVYKKLSAIQNRQMARLQADMKAKASFPRDGDEEKSTSLLFSTKQLQHEPRCLEALEQWPAAIKEAFEKAPLPRWNRSFSGLLGDFCESFELDQDYEDWKAEQPDRASLWKKTLRKKMDEALALFPAVAERWQQVAGLGLPWHFAAYVGFHRAVSSMFGFSQYDLGPGEFGIAGWFSRKALAQKSETIDNYVMVDRYYCDPPESATFGRAGVDWVHWCFLWDDPTAPPVAVMVIDRGFYTELCEGLTALDAMSESLLASMKQYKYDRSAESLYFRDRFILEWMKDVRELENELLARDGLDRRVRTPVTKIIGTYCPQHLDCTSEIPGRSVDLDQVHAVYEKSPEQRERWVEYARKQLAAGDARPAWLIGHELHAYGKKFNALSEELLAGAYARLKWPQFTKIVRVHHAQRYVTSDDE